MKPPVGYLPRKGDVITVRAMVKWDVDPDETTIFLETENGRDVTAKIEHIVDLVGRTWKVGDTVCLRSSPRDIGEVVCAMDGMSWVRFNTGAFATYAGLDLERAPELPIEPPHSPPTYDTDPIPEQRMDASDFEEKRP